MFTEDMSLQTTNSVVFSNEKARKLWIYIPKYKKSHYTIFQTHFISSFEASADVIACCGAPGRWGKEPSSNYARCTL